ARLAAPAGRPTAPARRRRPVPLRVEGLEDRSVPAVLTVTNTDDSGPGSLREAILDSNASAGVRDTIAFAIPGDEVHTIRPTSALPPIADPVVIDGYTQPGGQPEHPARRQQRPAADRAGRE
ncbi:MAG: hypothetical protein K2X87_02280, partial [Gemmataceae bacterium]|nr:hypothetical protein [Gemmataceae bacterium]